MAGISVNRLTVGLLTAAIGAGGAVASARSSSAAGGSAVAPASWQADPLAGPEASGPIEFARERLGGRFAGAWIDRSGSRPRLVIAARGDLNTAAESLRGGGAHRSGLGGAGGRGLGSIEIVAASASSSRLARARREAVAALDRRLDRFAVGVDPAAGAVEIQAAGLGRAAREAIARRVGGVAVSFQSGGLDFRRLAACPACYPPFRGGLALRIRAAGCTSGFTMKRRPHRFVGVTAGHCGPRRQPMVSIGGREVGRVDRNSFRGARRIEVDALRFRIRRSVGRPSVYIPALGVDVPVRGRLRNRDMVTGTAICFVGISSGGGCSFVTRTNLTIKTRNKVQSGLWCMGVPAIPGDSGGPVIQPQPAGAVRAAGIVSGTLITNVSEEMCYSPISRVAGKMKARLLSRRGD